MANLSRVRKVTALVVAIGIIGALSPQSGSAQASADTCDRRSVADLVKRFVRAYNTGDSEKLDQMWAPEPDFEWYSVSPDEREQDDAYDRDSLVPYFDQRNELNDRLRLKSLRVGPPSERGNFGIAYRLWRDSDQRAGRGRYHGKASAKEVMTLPTVGDLSMSRCVLYVWSMGRPER